ncbi:DUF7475 family protein [Haloplanus salilacus]|uniref:DUF7475 family protein n=1 Tax=Haloplanus salilacus TaxID=2949994 RepID=UPI0030CC109C
MSSNSTFETASLTTLDWVGTALAVVTGVIHLVLGVRFLDSPLGISFLLAGVAFLVAVLLLLVDYRRRLLYLVGIPFTAIQVVLYFPLNWPDVVSPVGLGDKAVQVALVAVLIVLYRRAS